MLGPYDGFAGVYYSKGLIVITNDKRGIIIPADMGGHVGAAYVLHRNPQGEGMIMFVEISQKEGIIMFVENLHERRFNI